MLADEALLREKLRKIERLFAGAGTAGEQEAAGAAADRIRRRIAEIAKTEPPIEMRFSIPDPWSRQLFIALCRRYGVKPYRYRRMQRQTLVVKSPKSFLNTVLWPEFREINAILVDYLSAQTARVIREEVHSDAQRRRGGGGGAPARLTRASLRRKHPGEWGNRSSSRPGRGRRFRPRGTPRRAATSRRPRT